MMTIISELRAVCAALVLLALLCGCSAGGIETISSGDTVSVADFVSESEVVSLTDEAVSGSDAVSSSEVVVYYPEVHIDGLVLPEEYGAGLLDEDAAMWLINEYRRINGLHQLMTGDFQLSLAARLRLEECQTLFSHDRPDGSRFSTAYSEVGILYRFCAENLALGQYTAEEVVRDWIESPSHRENLLSPQLSYMCVEVAQGEDDRPRWVFEAYSSQP